MLALRVISFVPLLWCRGSRMEHNLVDDARYNSKLSVLSDVTKLAGLKYAISKSDKTRVYAHCKACENSTGLCFVVRANVKDKHWTITKAQVKFTCGTEKLKERNTKTSILAENNIVVATRYPSAKQTSKGGKNDAKSFARSANLVGAFLSERQAHKHLNLLQCDGLDKHGMFVCLQ